MTTLTDAASHDQTRGRQSVCSTDGNVTRSLLGYLALAGPFYVALSVIQALTRSGFNFAHDEWSLLSLGHLGWIQTVNFILTGAMTISGATGVRRAISQSRNGGTWAPRLLTGYGVALIGAGVFHADPAHGFPAGAASAGHTATSWHASLHVLSGSIGFVCLIAACFVLARSYAQSGNRQMDVFSKVVGVAFTLAFAGIATGSASIAINLGFTAAVILSYAWLTTVAFGLYHRTRAEERERDNAAGGVRCRADEPSWRAEVA